MREDHGAETGQPAIAETLGGAGASENYVQRRLQDGVAVLTLAGPGGNRFAPALAQALARALTMAQRDPGVRAVVITARGPDFCAGPYADLPPPGPDPTTAPAILDQLDDLCRQIADSPRPVVCALHGRVASAGLALALAATERLADPRAGLHFPETRLARLPPGNGAVRLAWRIGAGAALALLQREGPMPAPAALAAGLIDALEAEGLVPAAIARAAALARAAPVGETIPPGLRDAPAFHAAIGAARAALPAPLPPQRRHEALLIDAVEAAQLLPMDQALALDSVLARDAATAPAARALVHLSRAARRVLDTPESRATPRTAPHKGPLLAALGPADAALLLPPLLRAGHAVTLILPDTAQLTAALEAVAEAQLAAVASGALTQTRADAAWAQLQGALTPEPESQPRLAIAGPGLLEGLAGVLPAGCALLAWNTALSGLAQSAQAIALMPAPVRSRAGLPQLVELVVRPGMNPATAARATELVLALHLTPLRAGGAPLLPPLLRAARDAAQRLIALGVPDAILRGSGLLPPAAFLPAQATPAPADTPAETAAEIPDLPLPAERLLLLALINAGARLLEAAQALRPSDIDIAMVLGAGYPNWRGGPMAEADSMGPLVLRHELLQAATLDPGLWSPAPLIGEMIRQGWRFEDLNTD